MVPDRLLFCANTASIQNTVQNKLGVRTKSWTKQRPQGGNRYIVHIRKESPRPQLYEQTYSVTETIRILGYPERATLYRWISEKGQPEKVRSTKRGENTPDHPRHPSVEVKLQVLHRCFEHGEDVKSVSEEIGYSRASIYNWQPKVSPERTGCTHESVR